MKYEIYFKGYTVPPHDSVEPSFMEDRFQYSLERAERECHSMNSKAIVSGYIRGGETCYEPRINPLPLPIEEDRPASPTHFADDATLARIAELERKNMELRKDAERYQWLRQYPVGIRPWDYYKLYTNELDAKIDAAIASEKENERG